MGDRANIRMKYPENKEIFLYSHWGGTELLTDLRDALKRGQDRWDDESYLARIIFRQMGAGNDEGNTGFGIAPYICDNEHPIVSVDCSDGSVEIAGKKFSFSDFVDGRFDEAHELYKESESQ